MSSNTTSSRFGTGLALLVAGLLVVSSIGPALAAPRVFVAGASLTEKTTATGDSVDVKIRLRNTGEDDGAGRVTITANGEEVHVENYAVESGGSRTVRVPLSFDEPGEYEIVANSKTAGTVLVDRAVARTTEYRSDGRTMRVRTGSVDGTGPVTATFPTTNDSLAVDSLTFGTSRDRFNRTVATYTDPEAVPFSLPSGDGTTVFGAVTVQQAADVDDRRVRIAVNQSVIDATDVDSDEVEIYSGTDGAVQRTNTTFEGPADGRYVYEARTNETETLFVGSLAPVFEVGGHTLSTSENGVEKELSVSANVTNAGDVAGEYTASLRVDGTAVSNETVTLGPGETRRITVSEAISRDGNYRVALDEQSVGSVVVETGDGEQTETDSEQTTGGDSTPESDDGADQTETGEATPPESDGGFDVSVPESVSEFDVGLTEIAIGGGVAVIGVLLVALRRW
ncbi:hypothetical protein [Halomicrobium katesii]|uniref:hypothetical protein n=1 Tax=Halomicrobium katesii TaxID=437163 RepID=UPI0003609602|nr:hypothetical protein [Halomicrobium katesii]